MAVLGLGSKAVLNEGARLLYEALVSISNPVSKGFLEWGFGCLILEVSDAVLRETMGKALKALQLLHLAEHWLDD